MNSDGLMGGNTLATLRTKKCMGKENLYSLTTTTGKQCTEATLSTTNSMEKVSSNFRMVISTTAYSERAHSMALDNILRWEVRSYTKANL